MVSRPLSKRESRYLFNRETMPPFTELRIVRKSEPDYEDTIYNLLRVGMLKHGPEVSALDQGLILHDSLGHFSNLPETIPSLESDGKSITKDDLVGFVKSRFKDDEDRFYSDSSENELWMCYYDGRDRVEKALIAATANLSKPNLIRSYNDGVTEYRGVLYVDDPVNRVIPVYLWPETSLQCDVLMLLTGKFPAMIVNMPEGYTEGTRKWTEVPHERFETSVLTQMIQWPGEQLPTWVEYEPNGPTTFPDFETSEAALFPKNTAIEITRLFDYQSRLIDTVRHGKLDDSSDQRLRTLAQNTSLSESEIRESIERALLRKSKRRDHLRVGQMYMLILVSDILPLEANFRVFQGQDYSPFDYVVLANQIGDLSFSYQKIKG